MQRTKRFEESEEFKDSKTSQKFKRSRRFTESGLSILAEFFRRQRGSKRCEIFAES